MGWQEIGEFAPSLLTPHLLIHTHTHIDACVWQQAGEKMAFSRPDQRWTASPHGPTDHLQTSGGHMQTHSPHHWLKMKNTSIFPCHAQLSNLPVRWNKCICFQLSTLQEKMSDIPHQFNTYMFNLLLKSDFLLYVAMFWTVLLSLLPYHPAPSLHSKLNSV